MKKVQTLASLSSIFIILVATFSCKMTQPPEIDYGPISMVYELPVVSGNIYFVAPDGNPD